VNLRIESALATGSITAHIEFLSERRPNRIRLRLRHPEKALLRSVTVNGAVWTDFDAAREWIVIEAPVERRYRIVASY
jgi:hypothetical protein